MLSSAAIATAAALGMTTNGGQESDFDINELVRRLQILTRVDYVSFVSLLSHIVNEELEQHIFQKMISSLQANLSLPVYITVCFRAVLSHMYLQPHSLNALDRINNTLEFVSNQC